MSGKISNEDKKIIKEDHKDDNNVIDSELLSHQTNYQEGNESSQHQNELNASKTIEDLRNATDLQQFDYQQLLKAQSGSQAQREAQAQAIQAQAQAQSNSVEAQIQQQHHASQLAAATSGRSLTDQEERHRIRKDNHKEVERRRRENINAGIKALSALLPSSETNKAQILQKAVEYIKRIKENENNNLEKWTLEKLLTDQAVAELNSSNEKLKQELEKTYRELEHYKKLAKDAGALKEENDDK